MRRIDTLQAHRAGVLALLRALPADPPTALLLALATRRSMRWMLEAAGIPTRGIRGELRVKGLLAVWLWTHPRLADRRQRGPVGDHGGARVALRRAESAAELARLARAPAPPPGHDADGGERRKHRHRRAGLSVVAPPPIKGAQQEVR